MEGVVLCLELSAPALPEYYSRTSNGSGQEFGWNRVTLLKWLSQRYHGANLVLLRAYGQSGSDGGLFQVSLLFAQLLAIPVYMYHKRFSTQSFPFSKVTCHCLEHCCLKIQGYPLLPL